MKLSFYRHPVAMNFGDELNPWLWPRLFGPIFDDAEDIIFIGIGSVLSDEFPKTSTKIVMGAGYGAYKPPPVIDQTWSVFFVRGPKTAEKLGLPSSVAITDSAVLIRGFVRSGPVKRYKVSYMPHWESLYSGRWHQACEMAGVHLIDPRMAVDDVLEEIAASDKLIAEAMHGAIVADALRVPWIPVRPIAVEHRFKWTDWTRSVDVAYRPRMLLPTTWNELRKSLAKDGFAGAVSACPLSGEVAKGSNIRHRLKVALRESTAATLTAAAAAHLWRTSLVDPVLSRDSTINSLTARAFEQVEAFTRARNRGNFGRLE